jgi:hypothetical protein
MRPLIAATTEDQGTAVDGVAMHQHKACTCASVLLMLTAWQAAPVCCALCLVNIATACAEDLLLLLLVFLLLLPTCVQLLGLLL